MKGKEERKKQGVQKEEEVNKAADFSGESKGAQAITDRGCIQTSIKAKIAPDEIKQVKKILFKAIAV